MNRALPIHEITDDLLAALADPGRAVLAAPAGSGKSTQVPQILLRSGEIDGRIVVLEPRRLAARLLARRVAAEMGEQVGESVGYQTRHERVLSKQSRIVFLTEGLFVRQMQADPTLGGVGAVLLDEFHERSVQADLALALLKEKVADARPDLKLVVMSATLDVATLSEYLDAPAVTAAGRAYPVDISYLDRYRREPPWTLAAEALAGVCGRGEPGDVLIFMDGAYTIGRTIEAGRAAVRGVENCDFRALHGSLPPAEQDRALSESDRRRVIVATNVAETSITIDGIRIVIDAGKAKVHRYDPNRGLNVLLPEPISHASADQRAGRAGRTASGRALRLWTRAEHRGRAEFDDPELKRVDLAEPMLQIRAMGVDGFAALDWLDRPEASAIERARTLLEMLDAVDASGALTEVGEQMGRLPVHPRVGRMLVEADRRGVGARAATWAAIVAERDFLKKAGEVVPDAEHASDIAVREAMLDKAAAARFDYGSCRSLGVNATAAREADRARSQLKRLLRSGTAKKPADPVAQLIRCVLVGYPDHVGRLRDDADRTVAMPGLKRTMLDRESVIDTPGLIVAVDARELGAGGNVRTIVSLASAVEPAWLGELFPMRLDQRFIDRWNDDLGVVERVEQRVLQMPGDAETDPLVIDETARPCPDPDVAATVLVERIIAGEVELPHWNEKVEQWLARVRCVAAWFPERGLITYCDDELRVILLEIVEGAVRRSQLENRACLPTVMSALSWHDQQFVEQMAPTELKLRSGRRMGLTYSTATAGEPQPPVGRATVQHLYDTTQTPRVAGGRVPVRLEILAPNQRPIQVTDDLASFWKNTYPDVKKELSRRYSKHEWR